VFEELTFSFGLLLTQCYHVPSEDFYYALMLFFGPASVQHERYFYVV